MENEPLGPFVEEAAKYTLIKAAHAVFGDPVAASCGTLENKVIPPALSDRSVGKLSGPIGEVLLVGCGSASQGLCALFFDHQEAVAKFLAANPIAAKTFVTKGLFRGYILWFRSDQWVPPNTVTDSLIWCSSGLVPIASIYHKLEASIVHHRPVTRLDFAELRWDSESERGFWLARQASLYGPLFRRIGPRKVILNDLLICKVYARDAGLAYDKTGQRFFQQNAAGDYEHLEPETLFEQFAAWLYQISLREAKFPPNELRLPRVRALVAQLKMAAAFFDPDPLAGLTNYVQTRLQLKPHADVTVAEVREDYLRSSGKHPIDRYPLRRFQRLLPKVIEGVFGRWRTNDIRRWNAKEKKLTPRRGFRGLSFRDGADRSDTTDGSDASHQHR